MIDSPAPRPMAERLSPIRCGRCNTPVAMMNQQVPGAEGGGLCRRCKKDENGRDIRVYTYIGVVEVVPSNGIVNGPTS